MLPIAAALLIFISLWFYQQPSANKKSLVKTGKDSTVGSSIAKNNVTELTSDPKRKHLNAGHSNEQGQIATVSKKMSERPRIIKSLKNTMPSTGNKLVNPITNNSFIPYKSSLLSPSLQINNDDFSTAEITTIDVIQRTNEMGSERRDIRPNVRENSRLALALSISPDINSVDHFSKGDIGASIGVGVSYRISPRLNIRTAIGYSKKVYSAMPYEYKAPWAASSAGKYAKSIDADCRVLDIPLNLDYIFSTSPKHTFFTSVGLSSYFMLEEKYTLVGSNQSGYPNSKDPSYSYRNENKHLLSVVNLSVGMSKPLNKHSTIIIEPYVKLPVTGVGQGKVNLQSVGVNFSLNYNLQRKEKSKSPFSSAAQ